MPTRSVDGKVILWMFKPFFECDRQWLTTGRADAKRALMSDKLNGVLAESEERYRSVITAMSEGVVLLAADSTILACNESAERLLGLSAGQMAGRTPYDPRWRTIRPDGSAFPPEEHPATRALRSGLPERDVEMGVHKPDDTLSWISINAQPLFRRGQDAPYAVVTTFSDVTERKRAELELRQSEERYRRIVETSVEGIWTIDLEGRTVFANERMSRMLRCTPEELFDSSLWDFVDPEEHALVGQRMQQRAHGVGEDHDFCFRAKDGTRVWTSLATCPITLPNGQVGAMAMVRDITMQKVLLDELHEARRLEAVGRLAGGVAHDFNNLLTAILTSVSLAERSGRALPQYLEIIRSAGERAAELTKQLLAFARRQKIQLEPLYLGALVQSMEEVLSRLVGEHIQVVLDIAPDSWPVLGDASQIEWVVLSLAANARDAMPEGGRLQLTTRTVTLGVLQAQAECHVAPGEYVLLTMRDTGPGLDAATREHIFEPFYSTKGPATGLGLPSCYGIVKQLGGHIRVRSDDASGTTFEIFLARAHESPQRPSQGRHSAKVRGHETILLAEDDELVRTSLGRALRDQGYRVLLVEDGDEALSKAAEHEGPIDLLITDVVMPRLGGFELATQLRKLRPTLPILFVSGYSDQRVPQQGLDTAPSQFLAKPYTLEELNACVRYLLMQARERL